VLQSNVRKSHLGHHLAKCCLDVMPVNLVQTSVVLVHTMTTVPMYKLVAECINTTILHVKKLTTAKIITNSSAKLLPDCARETVAV